MQLARKKRLMLSELPARRGVDIFDELATQAAKNADASEVILGKYSKTGVSYDRVGADRGALPTSTWTIGMISNPSWEENRCGG